MRNFTNNRDPHWVTVRFPCRCGVCERLISKGETGWYWPRSRSMDCDREACGRQSARDFQAAIHDEIEQAAFL